MLRVLPNLDEGGWHCEDSFSHWQRTLQILFFMPFGLTNVPTTFRSLMNQVFRPFLRHFVLLFSDDILVYSTDIIEHERQLAVVFSILRDNKLFANEKKCVIGHSQIQYLGHWISSKGVEASGEKVKAMVNWPQPKDISELRGFLHLMGYYRRFVKVYGDIATFLTKLLQKNGFRDEGATESFEQLKQVMISISISVPVLVFADFSLPFIIETDASGVGLGAVLSQHAQPISYFSQKLSQCAQAKFITREN